MDPLDMTTLFSLHPEIVYTLIDDEAVVMKSNNEQLFGTNQVATQLLKQLEIQPMSVEMMSNYLLAHFDVDEAQCLADTQRFTQALLDENMVIKATA